MYKFHKSAADDYTMLIFQSAYCLSSYYSSCVRSAEAAPNLSNITIFNGKHNLYSIF